MGCRLRCLLGSWAPSPFDTPRWLNIIEKEIATGPDTVRLSLRTNIVFIRLPRVVADLRWLRYEYQHRSTEDDMVAMRRLVAYACELCEGRETGSESRILHNMKLVRTADSSSRHVVPLSFTFANEEDFNALWMYWTGRLAAINIGLKAAELLPQVWQISTTELLAEKERLAANILMSWEYASDLGPFATLWIAKSFIHFWSALREQETLRGKPTVLIREWVLSRVNHPFSEWLAEEFGEQQMDVVADMLKGGLLGGFTAATAASRKL